MDKESLKRARHIAPGVIALACLLPLATLQQIRDLASQLPDGTFVFLLPIAAMAIGGVYYVLNPRRLLWAPFVMKCHNNIHTKLFEPYQSDVLLSPFIGEITADQARRLFYRIIDNDESLKDQAQDIRFNGAVLTTIIDASIISAFFAATYAAIAVLLPSPQLWPYAVISIVSQPILRFLRRRAEQHHIELQGEQLAVISQHHSAKVGDFLRSRLRNPKT